MGSLEDVTEKFIKQNNIQRIVNCIYGRLGTVHKMEVDVEIRYIPLKDTKKQNIIDAILTFCKIMEGTGKRTLIYCHSGESRAPSVVLGYLMKKQSYILRDAIEYVKKRRSVINPKKFMSQLRMFEKSILNGNYK